MSAPSPGRCTSSSSTMQNPGHCSTTVWSVLGRSPTATVAALPPDGRARAEARRGEPRDRGRARGREARDRGEPASAGGARGARGGSAAPRGREAEPGRPRALPRHLRGRRHEETLLYLTEPGELAAYEELRAGFTAAVSHELRTPLARILALLEIDRAPGRGPGRARRPGAAARSSRSRELIDDVLFLSELETGREVVSLGWTPALPVLAARRRGARGARSAGRRSAFASRRRVDLELPLRPRMLRVVATNLAENALRYAGPGAELRLGSTRRDGPRPRGRRATRASASTEPTFRVSSSASTGPIERAPHAAPDSASRS